MEVLAGHLHNLTCRHLHNLRPKSVRILSAAITIDRWTGAWSDDLAPCRGLCRVRSLSVFC